MVAGIINICGAFGGKMSGPTKNNAKGMFENSQIRNGIVKNYFRTLEVDPLGQYPLPNTVDMPIPRNWRERVESVLIEEGYKDGPLMYKGAKMCLHWPVWDYAFPGAKWVIVRRKTPDIINSCLRTGFMRAFQVRHNQREVGADNEYDGWLWWVRHHEAMFLEMLEAGLETRQVWPERMVDGDFTKVKEMIEWLELEWKEKEVKAFITPKLWKAKQRQNT